MFAPLAAWLRQRRIPCSENAPIAPHLYFRIGGTVSLLISPVRSAEDRSGGACATLAAGRGLRRPRGHRRRLQHRFPRRIDPGGRGAGARPSPPVAPRVAGNGRPLAGRRRDAQPAVPLPGARPTAPAGWSFFRASPARLGGAAAVNAGAFGRSLADVLLGADIVDEAGEVRAVDAALFRLPLPRLAFQTRQRDPAGPAPAHRSRR